MTVSCHLSSGSRHHHPALPRTGEPASQCSAARRYHAPAPCQRHNAAKRRANRWLTSKRRVVGRLVPSVG
ncbi:hypothetical protein BKA81DRAFT_372942 [Phyllosticta paracitricarpa]